MANFQLIATIVVAALAGAIVALKAIAPKTATTADDKVLERLEALEGFVEKLMGVVSPAPAPAPPAPPTPPAAP